MNKLTALMPMRHSSQRVKGKNYRAFGDHRPLFQHMLEKLLNISEIDAVVINTDSPQIKEISKNLNSDRIILIDRPDHLTDPEVSMNEIIKYDISTVSSEYYLQTHSTNPLLTGQTISNAITFFKENLPAYDSLFSVTRLQVRLWDQLTRPVNHNSNILLQTQDLPPIYEENSCFYLFNEHVINNFNNRIGARPFMYEIDKLEAVDIDEEQDFILAETLWRSNQG